MKVTSEVAKLYLRDFRPIERTYVLLDGDLVVTLRTVDKQTIDRIAGIIESLRLEGTSPAVLVRKAESLYLAASLSALKLKDFSLVFSPPAPDEELLQRLDFLPEPLYNVLCGCLKAFNWEVSRAIESLVPPKDPTSELIERMKAKWAQKQVVSERR